MVKISKKTATALIIISGVCIVLGAKHFILNLKPGPEKSDASKMKGNENAPIQIVEHIDFQCPACAAGSKYLKEIMQEHPQEIHLELKNFPLISFHKHSLLSASYAECAARQDKFWAYHDILIEYQPQWRELENVTEIFDLMADKVGLDKAKLADCLKDKSVEEAIMAQRKQGDQLGIKSTPTYFVNGEMLVGAKDLAAKITELLKNVKK